MNVLFCRRANVGRGAACPQTLGDPAHEEHENMLDWLGLTSAEEFDPAEFSLEQANGRLCRLQTRRFS